jgi:hypothetical protein
MPPLITNDRIIAQLYEEMHEEIAIWTILPDLKDKIITSTKLDKFATDIRKHIKDKTTPFKSSLKDWEIKDDLILYQHCVYVPPGETRHAILKLYHDTRTLHSPPHSRWNPGGMRPLYLDSTRIPGKVEGG